MPPYRCNRKKPKKENIFTTNGVWKIQSCEVYQDETDDGTTKKATFQKSFANGENIAGSQWQHEFESTMNFKFDENDSSDGEVFKTSTKRSFVQMELVQEQPESSCCVIL